MNRYPVLLVDDDPIVLKLNAAAVQSFGFETVIAETVEEAIEIAWNTKLAFVISDVQMPGEDGFEFVKHMINKDLKSMPIMYVTGHDELEVIRSGLKSGGDDFLRKGLPIEIMRTRIAFWMASGFKGLPVELRRRAIMMANDLQDDQVSSMSQALEETDGISKRVNEKISAEIRALPSSYGGRMIERIIVLARICRMILEDCKTLGDICRFPDTLFSVVQALRPKWWPALTVLLADFDKWAEDPRFTLGGSQPLARLEDYEWHEEEDDFL